MAEYTPHNPIGPDHQLPPPLPRSHFGVLFGMVVVILLAAALLVVFILHKRGASAAAGGSGGGRRGAGGGPAAITVATAHRDTIGVYLENIGTVTPVYTASITAQVTGVITDVHYTEGQLVKKGDPLIDIDDRPYQATLLQAQGTLKKDQNVLAQAQMDYERYEKAWNQNKAIAQQQLEDQEKLVLQEQGTVQTDEGLVKYDEVQVEFCHIKSPIDGRVGLRLIDVGNVVQANGTTPLVVVTQLNPITVVFTIAEDNIDTVVAHMTPNEPLTVDAMDRTAATELAKGTLLTLDNQIDTVTGTVKARATFKNDKNKLFPNQFVNTKLLVYTLKNITVVPASALQQNESESFVYVVGKDEKTGKTTVTMHDVTPGVTDNNLTQVQGINPGTVVANSGFERLTDKAEVTILQGGSAEGGSTTRPATQSGTGGQGGRHHPKDQTTQPSEDVAP